MGVWRKGERHIAGAKQIETAEDVDPPEPGIVTLQAVHNTSVGRAARAYKTGRTLRRIITAQLEVAPQSRYCLMDALHAGWRSGESRDPEDRG